MSNKILGVIGGSGFYNLDSCYVFKDHQIDTPYGSPSSLIYEMHLPSDQESECKTTIFFLPRHGVGHSLLPSEINYAANIYALKLLGVKQLLSVSAVGSLQQEHKPGSFSLPLQYVDATKGKRISTFFGDGLVGHVSTARAVCSTLATQVSEAATRIADVAEIKQGTTYVGVEGPRLGTKAESLFYKNVMQADLVGMTNVPEVFLAREAQICYASLCVITDYDCWQENADQDVTVAMVLERFGKSIESAKQIVLELARNIGQPDDAHRLVLKDSILCDPSKLSDAVQAKLAVLLK